MFIPEPINGFVLEHADFKGAFESCEPTTKKLIIEMMACMTLRDGTQPDGSWGSVRVNSDQLRDAFAFLARCTNG